MPSADFTVNGSPVTGPVLVTASTLTTIALSSLSGATDLACEFIGASDPGVTYPTITLTAPGTWTFTSPAAPSHGYGLNLLIRVTNGSLMATAIIGVGSVSQLVPNEYLERGADGWTHQLNENTRGAAVVDAVLALLPGGFPDASLVTDGMMTMAHVGELNAATAHLTDPTAAHAASAIANTPAGTIAATTVQGAIDEIVSDLAASTGTELVGGASVASTPKALAAGTLRAQLVEALGHINAQATCARRIVYPTAGSFAFTPATYTALGCTMCRVLVKGGGGGGGTGSGTAGGGGGGGGGSGIEAIWQGPLSLLPASVSMTVGAGGSIGNAGNASTFYASTVATVSAGGKAGSNGGATSGGNGGAGCSSGGGGGTGAGGGTVGTSPDQFGGSCGNPGSAYSSPNGGAGGGGGNRVVNAIGSAAYSTTNGSGAGGASSTGAGNAGSPGVGAGAGGGGTGGASVGGSGGGGAAGCIPIGAGSLNGVSWSAAPGDASTSTGGTGLIVIDVW